MIFRQARHTNNLDSIKEFYTSIIGLSCLGEFKNHDGYDGIFIGSKGLNWHLEFTQTKNKTNHTFDDDDLYIFYPNTSIDLTNIIDQIRNNSLVTYLPKNPYWQTNGIMIKDPDGYGIIISLKTVH